MNQFQHHRLRVEVLGGEPLLRPKLIEKLVNVIREYDVTSLKISTNGSIFSEETGKLLKQFDEVQVSLDAHNKSLYRRIRGGDWGKVMGNIRSMLSYNLNVTLSFVLMKLNLRYIEEFFRLAENLNIDTISFGYLIPAGRGKRLRENVLTFSEIEDASRKIESLSRKYGIRVHNPLPSRVLNKPYICPAGNYKFSVLPDGSIVPCIYFRNVKLGEEGKIKKLAIIKSNYTICPATQYP